MGDGTASVLRTAAPLFAAVSDDLLRHVWEAGATLPWWKYVGMAGRVIGIDSFGASGKAADLFRHFGITAARVREALDDILR